MKKPKRKSTSIPTSERNSRGIKRPDVLFPMPPSHAGLPDSYGDVLAQIKQRIQTERLRVVLAANSAMVMLYWDIGRLILERQEHEGWGAKVIDRLSVDLREAYPDMSGLSPRNLKYMRAFASAWPDRSIVQQLAAQIPWFHNCVLLNRVPDDATRLWYIQAVIKNGWSRNILELQIQSQAHLRQGKAITNFALALPPADSDMATQVFKDPYIFDFLTLAEPFREQELELALLDQVHGLILGH
jgi:predicted nuclease of restriction endonuclease-like (RecB) superfamily